MHCDMSALLPAVIFPDFLNRSSLPPMQVTYTIRQHLSQLLPEILLTRNVKTGRINCPSCCFRTIVLYVYSSVTFV